MENEKDPLIENEEKDDDDDDDDENTTHPFHSTPGPSGEEIPMTTMNREKEKEPSTAETSFIEGSPLSRVLTSNEKAWESLPLLSTFSIFNPAQVPERNELGFSEYGMFRCMK